MSDSPPLSPEKPHVIRRWGRAGTFFIQGLIVLSLVTFSLETLPDLEKSTRQILRLLEIATVSIFTIEYGIRFVVASPRRSYVLSFFGLIDLIAILPFYLSLGVDLRGIRGIRLLRLFRILKLVRYSRAIRRYHIAFRLAKEELVLFGATMALLLFLAASGIYFFESPVQPETFTSVFDGLWWAVTTLTTVGYGDSYPITAGGKFFTFIILMLGLGTVALPSGILAGALGKARELEMAEHQESNADTSSRRDEIDESGSDGTTHA